MNLTLVTGSQDKAAEISRMLALDIEQVAVSIPEVQGVELSDVVGLKATAAYHTLGRPVMVEDTGLFVAAWGGLPGALIKWFLERAGPSGICRMLEPFSDRRATAKTCVAVHDGALHVYEGVVEGEITPAPRGKGGFGFDPIFIPQGESVTFAEMSWQHKDRVSMRRTALERFRDEYLVAGPQEGSWDLG